MTPRIPLPTDELNALGLPTLHGFHLVATKEEALTRLAEMG